MKIFFFGEHVALVMIVKIVVNGAIVKIARIYNDGSEDSHFGNHSNDSEDDQDKMKRTPDGQNLNGL